MGNYDWKKNWLHVYPGALGCWGGVKHNEYCETDIEGLYAAGEVGYVNHLGHALVFGARAGAAAGRYARFNPRIEVDIKKANKLLKTAKEIRKRLPNDEGKPRDVKKLIKKTMGEYVGVLRSAPGLQKGIEELLKIREKYVPKLYATNPIQLRHAIEAINMIETGLMVARSALIREETRGIHNRIDFPFTDYDNWTKNIVIWKDEVSDEVLLDTEPVVKTRGLFPPKGKHPVKGMPKWRND